MANSHPGEPRLPPLPADQWGDEVLAALHVGEGSLLSVELKEALRDDDLARFAEILPNGITTLLYHTRLTGRFLAFNGVLLSDAALPPRWRELLVLRVAWRSGSIYEWVQHVRMAPRYDITDEDLVAISEGGRTERWAAPEGDLLTAADELLDDYCISAATWSRLTEFLDEAQLVEVPFVVGSYTCLAMAYKSFGMQLDPSLQTVKAPVTPPQSEE